MDLGRIAALGICGAALICLAGSSRVAAQAPPPSQATWMRAWLDEYAQPAQRVAVASRLGTVASLKTFEADLDKIATDFTAKQSSPVTARRVLAGFALEAATSHLNQPASATKLVEWGCRQVRRNMPPGDFELAWHLASFAALSGAIDPDALEAHTAHTKLQFPKEPRIAFERGVAAEQRAAPFLPPGRISPADATKRNQEAAAKFREAAADASVHAEAELRLGHVEMAVGHLDLALAALRDAGSAAIDPDVIYLARLFEGQVLERMNQRDEAGRAYATALALRPGTQSASIALAALWFRQGARDQADFTVAQVLGQPPGTSDPWWSYWPADFRRVDSLMAAMRTAIK